MVTVVQCNCGAKYRRSEEKFLLPHTGDAICLVCGAALAARRSLAAVALELKGTQVAKRDWPGCPSILFCEVEKRFKTIENQASPSDPARHSNKPALPHSLLLRV